MGQENKTGRPIANNVNYFPHICKYAKELMSNNISINQSDMETFSDYNNAWKIQNFIGLFKEYSRDTC